MRYAAAPIAKLRWQAPTDPPSNKSGIISATEQPPICPQTGGYGLPDVYGFTSGYGDEDCLYLNVYAAPNASALPVLVWIRKKWPHCESSSMWKADVMKMAEATRSSEPYTTQVC